MVATEEFVHINEEEEAENIDEFDPLTSEEINEEDEVHKGFASLLHNFCSDPENHKPFSPDPSNEHEDDGFNTDTEE